MIKYNNVPMKFDNEQWASRIESEVEALAVAMEIDEYAVMDKYEFIAAITLGGAIKGSTLRGYVTSKPVQPSMSTLLWICNTFGWDVRGFFVLE